MELQKKNIAPLLKDFKLGAEKLYGKRLKSVVLFGSFARGEEGSHSDIDIMLVLKDKEVKPFREIDYVNDLAFDLMLVYGWHISIVPVSQEEYEKKVDPFFLNVRKEGVLV